MTATYQLIRTDATGAERICIGGDIAAEVYSEKAVNEAASVLQRHYPDVKYSARKLTDDKLVKLSAYDKFCLGFGQVAVPVVGVFAVIFCAIWWVKAAFNLFTWIMS